jgi:malonyl-CoA O-methyltransferase
MTQPTTALNPAPSLILPTREGYDRWAPNYDTDGNPLVALEEPWVARLLDEVRGLAVLDVGCGTGRHAVQLAAAGAIVHALDFSPAMLELARQKAGGAAITFQPHDLAKPLPFAPETFDRVLCALVLDHIADLEGLFREMWRVCRSSGTVVVSVMHPAMMLRGVQARFHEPESGQEIRPASYPHQLSDYVLAAARVGFAFDHLSEHAVDEALASRLERARKYVGWPLLFLMRLEPMPTGKNYCRNE